jgi:hypothetical protein
LIESENSKTQIKSISHFPAAIDILGESLDILWKNFLNFFTITIIPFLIVGLFLGAFWLLKYKLSGILFIFFIIIFILASFISFSWGPLALIYAAKERVSAIEAFSKTSKKIISNVWISFLVTFITLGGSLLFLVPGIIFSVWFLFSQMVLVFEGERGMNALLKSKEYVKNNFLAVLWRYFFIFAISLLISFIPRLIFSVIKILGFFIVDFLLALFLIILTTIYLVLVYSYLKEIKGEIVFKPTKKEKAVFVFFAIFGFLFIPLLYFFIIFSAIKKAKKGSSDAAIRGAMSELRIVAELDYDKDGNYNAVCKEKAGEAGNSVLSDTGEYARIIEKVKKNNGGKDIVCNEGGRGDKSDKWAAWTPLASHGQFFCVDYTGNAKVLFSEPPKDSTTCPSLRMVLLTRIFDFLKLLLAL